MLAIVGLDVLARSAPARAQTNLSAVAATGVGVTDNIAADSSGNTASRWGALWHANAAVAGSWIGQLQQHDLRYAFGVTRSFSQGGLRTQSHSLSWNGSYTPSGKFSLRGMTSASLSRMDVINISSPIPIDANNPPDPTTVTIPANVQSLGPISSGASYLSLAANVTAAWRPTPMLSWTAGTSAHMMAPLQGQLSRPSYGIDEVIGHDHIMGIDSFVSTATLGYLYAPEVRDGQGNVTFAKSDSIHGHILAGWHRELSAYTNFTLSVGGLGAMAPEGGPIVIGPSWRGAAAYLREFATVSATIDRTPMASLNLGRIAISDRAVVNLSIPIDRAARFHGIASGTFSRSRFVDASNQVSAGVDTISTSAALTFQPLLWPLSFALHYTRLQQLGNAVVNGAPLPRIERQILTLSVTGTWSRYPPGGGDAGQAGQGQEYGQ